MPLRAVPLSELSVRGGRALASLGLYRALERRLKRDGYRFRVATDGDAFADRVRFLNLTFWQTGEGGDVLPDPSIDADVVAHAALHHVTAAAVGSRSRAAMFLGESIASAYDLFLVGHLLRAGKRSAYLDSQVPAMTEAARMAGLGEAEIGALLTKVAEDPVWAFASLRGLLFDVLLALDEVSGADEAAATLDGYSDHPFHPLLHHFELSTWLLYARAWGAPGVDEAVLTADRELRAAPDPLAWIEANWVGQTSSSSSLR